ncbi:unnamed protein product [Urochloa decumbens]|uniref:Uncharacterized protein n=1 Tax=Urochloa decumbens TaxID=240449 RepID=A0ABC8VGW2_9POAL
MEVAASSSSSSVSALLRHRLRATARRCFGNGGGLGERMRWRRRAGGAGEFRYDPLSYALNFDEGDLLGADGEDNRRGDRFRLCRSFSSQLARAAAVEVA